MRARNNKAKASGGLHSPPGYTGFVHPRRSSDMSLVVEDREQRFSVYGVFDTIGRTPVRVMQKFLNELSRALSRKLSQSSLEDLAQLSQVAGELLVDYNRILRELNHKSKAVFGFCMVLALRFGRDVRLFGLGDCRAYLLSPETLPDGESAGIRARLLSSDDNRLADLIHEQIGAGQTDACFKLLPHEMQGLGRELTRYWGWPDDDAVRRHLQSQDTYVKIEPGDVLLLTTDGLLSPILQGELDRKGDMITLELFRMEQWLGRALERAGVRPEEGMKAWRQGLLQVRDASIDYGNYNRSSRDHMAILLVG